MLLIETESQRHQVRGIDQENEILAIHG
jgi:hypothetical protein